MDAQAPGGGPDRLGAMIGRAVPEQDQLAGRDLGAQSAQHVDGIVPIGPVIGPDPHLAFIVEIQPIERDLGLQAGRGSGDLEALAALAPAVAEIDVLMDMRLIEVNHLMALIARTIQQCADLGDESLAFLRLGAAEQFVGLLPRQLEPVQRTADGLAAEATAELLPHEVNQTPQRPTWLYIGSDDGRTGCLAFCGANLLAKRGSDIGAKGG